MFLLNHMFCFIIINELNDYHSQIPVENCKVKKAQEIFFKY